MRKVKSETLSDPPPAAQIAEGFWVPLVLIGLYDSGNQTETPIK